ncbi:Uncharacterised protein [Serratia fonticola]|nr:Uncharacterised protein [Serratia fonticola]
MRDTSLHGWIYGVSAFCMTLTCCTIGAQLFASRMIEILLLQAQNMTTNLPLGC